ncbi:MAG: filamentous hemagglutinin N-terminal domain-containing protein, partial [Verrucomicrobiota bacterium]
MRAKPHQIHTLPFFRRSLIQKGSLLASLFSLLFLPVVSMGNPFGEVVIHGDVNFSRSGNTLDVIQGSSSAIIEWQGFSIGAAESTIFSQATSSAVALNRVVGGNQSVIDGLLQANGNIWLINPNGILTGPGSRIDVGGLVLSTLDVSNSDFLSGADARFSGNSAASITTYGTISAAQGDVHVFAQNVANYGSIGAVDGKVMLVGSNEVLMHQGTGNVTVSGTTGYGSVSNSGDLSGRNVSLEAVNHNAMAMAVNQTGTVRITGAETKNGRVMLTARGGSSVNVGGSIEAPSATVSIDSEGEIMVDGRIDVSSSTDDGGNVEIIGREITIAPGALLEGSGLSGGTLEADAAETLEVEGTLRSLGSTGQGGTINLTGDEVILRSTTSADVSGAGGGGSMNIGGGFQGNDASLRNSSSTLLEDGVALRSDGTGDGANGGQVVVWSDGATSSAADISVLGMGNGGFVEVSGLASLGFTGDIDLSGVSGQGGMLLLDPVNVQIGQFDTDNDATGLEGELNGGASSEYASVLPSGVLDAAAIATAWDSGNVVIHTSGTGDDAGNVVVEADVQLIGNSEFDLSIFAHGDITVGVNVDVGTDTERGPVFILQRDTGNINLIAGWDGSGVENFTPQLPQGTVNGT